jgi:glycosyltransferase involved in cell wall biosynthesis
MPGRGRWPVLGLVKPRPGDAFYAHGIVSVRWMRPADTLGARGDATIVCLVPDPTVPEIGPSAVVALARVTSTDVPVVLLGWQMQDEAVLAAADGLEREIAAIEPGASSLSDLLRRASRLAGQGDLVLVSAGCRLPGGWLERLRAAVLSDTVAATATPVSSGGATVGVDAGSSRDPDGLVQAASTLARPRLLIGGPYCLYVRRSALELVGGFPAGHQSLGDAIAAFCVLCLQAGLVHVLADDLYVPRGAGAEDPAGRPAAELRNVDRSDDRSALRRSLELASSALTGLSVTIDARSLVPSAAGGTQRYTRELVLALARCTDAAVRVVVADDVPASAMAELAGVPGIEVITYAQAVSGAGLTHVVHRPQQVFSTADLNLLTLLGRRVVITHQDLIAYHNPSYHETVESWEQYRRVTRIALAAADRVLFFSEHSRRDAEAEDLVTPGRSEVVGAALAPEAAVELTRPPGAPQHEEFILCLGPDYRHKNRPFAIALAGALRAQHAWPGKLVLAGPHVALGSSRSEEEQLLAGDGDLQRAVVNLGPVDGPGRAWLLANARAIVVPSVVEGFGLVPLESAQAGVPCLFAAQSSLVEVIDGSLATLVPWDPDESARRVMPLLRTGGQRRLHVQALRVAAERWSWEAIAGQVMGAYECALRMPYRAAAVRAWQELERERHLVEVDRARRVHEERLAGLGANIALAAGDGFLTPSQQRGLLRVGARPALRRLTLWPFAALGSIGSPRRPRDPSRRHD